MASNINVKISADVVDLQAKFAVARAESQALGADLTKLARTASSSGMTDELKAQLTQTAEKFVAVRGNVNALGTDLKKAFGEGGGGTVGELRHLNMAIREIAEGRIEALPLSFARLAHSFFDVSFATTASIMGVSALAAGLGYLFYQEYEAEKELYKLEEGFKLTGRGAEESAAAVSYELGFLESLPGVSRKVAESFMEMSAEHATWDFALRNQVEQLMPAFVTAYGDEAPKAAAKLTDALSDLTLSGFRTLDKEMLNLSPTQYEHIEKLIETGETAQAVAEIMQALSKNTGIYIKSLGDQVYDVQQKIKETENAMHGMDLSSPGAAGMREQYIAELGILQDKLRGIREEEARQGQQSSDNKYKREIDDAVTLGQSLDHQGEQRKKMADLKAAEADADQRHDVVAKAAVQNTINLLQQQIDKEDEATRKKSQREGASAAAKQWTDFAAAERAKISATEEGSAQRLAIEHEWLARAKSLYGEASSQYQDVMREINTTTRAAVQQRREIEADDLRTELTLQKAAYAERKALLDAEVSAGRMSKQQELAALEDMLQEQEILELASVSVASKGYALDSAKFREYQNQKRVIAAQTQAEINKLVADSAKAQSKETFNLNQQILSSEGTLVSGIFSRRQTLSQTLRSLGLKMLEDWVTFEVQRLTRTLLTETAISAITSTEVGARIASWLGLETASVAQSKTQALADIPAYTGIAAMAAASSVASIPYVGPALAAAAAADMEALGAESLAMASFDVGTNYVPYDMVAHIHQGERIIPKADNADLMTAVNGNGNNRDGYSRDRNRAATIDKKSVDYMADRLMRKVEQGIARGGNRAVTKLARSALAPT